MRFKTDENLPVEVAEWLNAQGHDALSVRDQNLQGAVDPAIAKRCRDEQRAIVTLDLDFSDIRRYPPADYAGIVVLRPLLQTVPTLCRMMQQVHALLSSETLTGSLWVVDEHHVRIRSN
jgi:predicted nuclease of predicted toxin-antitoxin system